MKGREGPDQVVVAGCGVAGITLSFLLAEAGWKVVLLEASPRLGGRAFSFAAPPFGGEEVDNGPHALVGAYREFRGLLRRLGKEEAFFHAPSLDISFMDALGRIHRLRAPGLLPAPLHLLAGILTFGALGAGERIRTALALGRLTRRGKKPSGTVGAWLRNQGLRGGPADYLLGPLCRAILNTPEEEASLPLFAAALRESFQGPSWKAALWIPRLPWSRILGEPARTRLEALGVDVRLRTRLEGVEVEGGAFRAARVPGGRIPGRALFVCLPPWSLSGILPGEALPRGIQDLRPGPMETLYVRVLGRSEAKGPPPPVLGLPPGMGFDFLVRRGDRTWAFLATPSRTGKKEGKPGDSLSLAKDLLAGMGAKAEPERALRLAWRKALLHQPAGVEELRPGPVTAVEGLFLAGDWIATGLPATLESAARSAGRAARAFLEKIGGE